MGDSITEDVFQDLRERILNALRPRLTKTEISVLSASFYADEYSLSTGSAGPFDVIEIIEDEDAENPTIRFEEIRIKESRRRQGLGTIVMTAFADFARERGLNANLSANPMEPSVNPGREASTKRLIRYYERFGFQDDGDGVGNMQVLNVCTENRVTPW